MWNSAGLGSNASESKSFQFHFLLPHSAFPSAQPMYANYKKAMIAAPRVLDEGVVLD